MVGLPGVGKLVVGGLVVRPGEEEVICMRRVGGLGDGTNWYSQLGFLRVEQWVELFWLRLLREEWGVRRIPCWVVWRSD